MRGFFIAVLLLFLFNPITAHAYQSEVDPQDVAEDKAAKILRRIDIRRELRRIERQEAWLEAEQEWLDEVVVGGIADIIRSIFGSYGATAVSVATCESSLDPTRWNPDGEHFGLFQMGESERATYGGSSTDPTEQTQAAYAYFLASGSDWSPWSGGACA
jgi:hypothetical protein